MRKKIVAGNWKMNGTKSSIQALLLHLIELQSAVRQVADCIVFPPAIYLPLVSEMLENTPIQWGAQNIFPQEMGAYTGEISTTMVSDYRCKYVLVGHSERRTLFGENEKIVAEKFHHVKEHGMIPILCVGETLEEREKGQTEEIILKQLHSISERFADSFSNSIIAYEPVWAIGTGKTANVNDVQKVHQFIRAIVAGYDKKMAENLPLIYGGSVNEKNASALFSMPDVDGGLVGGASLNAQQFVDIIQCIN